MALQGGYAGKILRVDLSKGEIREDCFGEEVLKKYLGGSALGAKIIFDGCSIHRPAP